MSGANRLLDAITTHSKVVIVVLLLATVAVGAGAPLVDDDSSLEQFETDSPEAEAQAYANANFSTAGQANTTTVQVIARGDNVLTKESLLSSLRFQQEIQNTESINATLVENDSMIGVENLVARQSIAEMEADDLERMVDDFEDESEAFQAEADAIQNESEALEAEGDRLRRASRNLQRDAQALEEDQADLEQRTGVLQQSLEELAAIQTAYDTGQIDETEYEDQTEAEIQNATEQAALDAEQETVFRDAADDVQTLTSQRNQLEAEIEQLEADREDAFEEGVAVDPDNASILSDGLNETIELQTAYDFGEIDETEYEQGTQAAIDDVVDAADLDDQQEENFTAAVDDVQNYTAQINDARAELADVGEQLEGAFEAGTAGVFAEEFQALAERGEQLEQRGQSLQDWGDRLEQRGDELEERVDALEAWADRLARQYDELRGELERWGAEFEDDENPFDIDFDDEDGEFGDGFEGTDEGAGFEEDEFDEDDLEPPEDVTNPSLERQIEHLESMNETEFEQALVDTLSEDGAGGFGDFALQLMPSNYEPGSTQASARMMTLTQSTETDAGMEMGGADRRIVDAQLDLRDLANTQDVDYVVFGAGIMTEEIEQSMGDSLAIVGPLALLFVVLALIVAYRDLLDIFLGVVGILAVLLWTFGFMGWAGIAFNQMFIAIPVLLIGLSVDYAIHVFMRHREQRQAANGAESVGGSMRIALAGVGVALLWVTATTAIGFLANLVSPIGPIQQFGIVSAFGIGAALLVFGALIPAAKVELDEFLESHGWDRRKRAFGTGESRSGSVLQVGSVAARRAPLAVLVVALLLTAGGVYGASQVDTSFEEEDFLADSPPDWTYSLPGGMAPGQYQAKEHLAFVNDNFRREDSQAQVLIRGDVTDPEVLQRIAAAEDEAADSEAVYVLASGQADVRSPLSAMEDAAAENDSFATAFEDADTTGDGVPDRNVEALYDELLEIDDGARELIYRTDGGDYEAVRLIVSTDGSASSALVTDELRAIAAGIDDPEGRWSAIATGDPIVSYIVEQELLNTVIQSLLITLIAVFTFLTAAYRLTGNSASLGAVTLLPVALTVSWILGTMYLLGMPFNVLTGMITSLTIGLGVAYSIHVSSRYTLELDRQGAVWPAMRTTVTGTGGALLGSAATTIGGFGVLVFAILPALQQFGIITGLTIFYAFLASVIVLPSLLVFWTRYFGPADVTFAAPGSEEAKAAAGGGAAGGAAGSTEPGDAAGPDATDGGSVAPADFGGDDE